MAEYLRFERVEGKFSEESAALFIRQFRETLDFAGLLSSDKMSEELTVKEEPAVETPVINPPGKSPLGQPKQPQPAGPFISFPLSGSNVFELRLGSRVTRHDFERLKKLIDLSEDSLVELEKE